MKCEIKRKVKVNAEEKEKIEYIKRELEKKGLKVTISTIIINEENNGNEEVEYLGKDISKMPKMWEMSGMSGMSGIWGSNERTIQIQDPKGISNPYRSFKELLDNEKKESMNELKGGAKKGGEPIPGLKYEVKEAIIKIEVET